MSKDVGSARVTVRELLLENAMLSRGIARDLSVQHATAVVLGDRPCDPAMVRDVLRKAITHFDKNADDLEALAERSRRALSQMTPLRFMVQMTISFLVAIVLAVGLLSGLFYVLDLVNPPHADAATVWTATAPEPNS